MNSKDTWIVINALRIAATVYAADAEMVKEEPSPRLYEQFMGQYGDVVRIADQLEADQL